MATKLDVNTGNTYLGKKIWETHQKNEETHVNEYKEATCFGCLKSDAAAAGVFDICGDCAGKRGRETLLVSIKGVYYGICYFCGEHHNNGLVEITKGEDQTICERCDIDGSDYNGWDEDNEHCPICWCFSDDNKKCVDCKKLKL